MQTHGGRSIAFNMFLHFVTLWPWPLTFWFNTKRGLVVDYPCAKFGDFIFSRFGFIIWTDRQSHRIKHRRRSSPNSLTISLYHRNQSQTLKGDNLKRIIPLQIIFFFIFRGRAWACPLWYEKNRLLTSSKIIYYCGKYEGSPSGFLVNPFRFLSFNPSSFSLVFWAASGFCILVLL